MFFNSPTDVAEKHIAPGTRIRIGGLVKDGSVQRGDNLRIRFEVTDGKSDIAVRYQGIVPDLFREGQGVVAEGKLEAGGTLVADTVLAKHDERYMPKEVVDALKKSGRWQRTGKSPEARRNDPRTRSLCSGAGAGARPDPVGGADDRRAHARCRADAAGDRRPR